MSNSAVWAAWMGSWWGYFSQSLHRYPAALSGAGWKGEHKHLLLIPGGHDE